MSSKTLIAVVGPTAIGKTSLGIILANHFGAEIISADSRQFYREMSIGTAVPTDTELKAAKHHFIQHKSILEPYSVGDFEKEAILQLDTLFKSKDMVVMVGGSGLYVDAVIHGLDDFPEIDPKIRESLNTKLQKEGLQALQAELKFKDPTYYTQVDLGNPHRLIRALEVCIASGRPYSSFLNQKKSKRSFNTLYVGIQADREVIYGRINERVGVMMKAGLLEEAKELYRHRTLNALQTVGYHELFEYFDGNCDLDFAVSEIKKNTRRFAKRQLTWLRKNNTILWVDYGETPERVIQQITSQLNAFPYVQN